MKDKKMTNLNSLLQEAKPLYQKRKHQQKTYLKTAVFGLVFLAGVPFFLPHQNISLNALYTDLYDEENFASLFEYPDDLTDEYTFFGIV
jgi:hypothetical protein